MPNAPVNKVAPERFGRFDFSAASCRWNFSRACCSRMANSVGMCFPSKEARALRTSGNCILEMFSRKGIRETSSLSLGSPVHLGIMMAFSGWCFA